MLSRLSACFLTIAVLTLSSLVAPLAAQAQDDQALTQKQQDAVKKLIHDYLIENPGLVADALDALRDKEQLAAESAGKRALHDRNDEIYFNPDSPVLGNPHGDVTIVEFFDYRCPFCKAMDDTLFDVVKADGKIRLVMKEFPILGPDSVFAAKAALATRSVKGYEEFHRAMMHVKGPLTEQAVFKAAVEAGLDVKRLRKEMEDPHIDDLVKSNLQLAHALDLTATPGFILGDQLIAAPMNKDALKLLVEQARKAKQ